eukprot:15409225-Alexandrium_andersonii.AAC.1
MPGTARSRLKLLAPQLLPLLLLPLPLLLHMRAPNAWSWLARASQSPAVLPSGVGEMQRPLSERTRHFSPV